MRSHAVWHGCLWLNRGDYIIPAPYRLDVPVCCTISVMNGDQDKPAAEPVRQPDAGSAAVYNPPSLVEPVASPASQASQAGPASPGLAQPVPQADVTPATGMADQPAPVANAAPAMAAAPEQPAVMPEAEVPSQESHESPSSGGFYHASSDASQATHTAERAAPLSWVAGSESFQHHPGNWRMRMSLIGLGGALLVFVITRSYFSSIAILVAGLLFAFLGAKPPRPIEYRIDAQGLVVGRRRFSYGDFRSFWVSETMPTLNLVPLKRFSPVLVVRCDPKIVTEIVNAISTHLPMQAPQTDAVDGLIRKLKV